MEGANGQAAFQTHMVAGTVQLLMRQMTVQVFVSIPACIDLLEGPYIVTHKEVVKAFRPAGLVRQEKPKVAG